VQTNSSTGQNFWLPSQTPLRYLRDGHVRRVDFGGPLGDTFLGAVTIEFKDMFGLVHAARQPVKLVVHPTNG